MAIGEKIQFYRKKLDLSQEELGQKLLVSRQTISLWEKGQTVPTIDNLIRLKEIFGVSVDELLDCETFCNNEERIDIEKPFEKYNFNFSASEIANLNKYTTKKVTKKIIRLVVLFVILFLSLVGSNAPDLLIGFFIGLFLLVIFSYIKIGVTYKKSWKTTRDRITQSFYEYEVYNNYFTVNIIRNNEKMRFSKIYFYEIEQIKVLDDFLEVVYSNQSFILRKSDLLPNSAFFIFLNNNPTKMAVVKKNDKWTILSKVFFVASILSIFIALILMSIVSSINHLFTENMWLFFVAAIIPFSSIVFGFVLKSKGYLYKKNIVAGVIMTILLCLYGSFVFVVETPYGHSDEIIIDTEQLLNIDIPEHKQINTRNWTDGVQSVPRGYIWCTSDVYFDENVVVDFESQIARDDKWLTSVPSDMIGISYPLIDYTEYDFVLIYNVDTGVYNSVPEDSGTYHFINIFYVSDDNKMMIAEYQIDYVK